MATLSGDLEAKRGSLSQAFTIQKRVIKALIMRELHTRYGRENIGYLWLILEPMLLATVIGLIHARGGTVHQGDITPVPLSLLGYCNFMVFRSIFGRAEGAIEQNLPLMYHRTVRIVDILVSRALLEVAGCWMAFAILMGAAVGLQLTHLPERPIWLLAGMFAMVWFAIAGSFIVGGLTYDRRTIGRLVHPLTYVMMPLSGAFFTMSMLPGPLREAFLWVPMAHIFEMIRFGWFVSATDHYLSLSYLFAWLLGMTLIGLILINNVRKRIQMP